MLVTKRNKFKELFFLFAEESVQEIKKHIKGNTYTNVHGLLYITNSSGSTTYGDKNRKIINTSLVHSLDGYQKSFNTEKGKNLTHFLINSGLFLRDSARTEENEYKRFHELCTVGMLIDFFELHNSFTYNKNKINQYIDDFIDGLESPDMIVKLVLVLPNLSLPPLDERNIKLEDGFILKKFSDKLKVDITNSFISTVSNLTYGNIGFESIFSGSTILYKEFRIPKDNKMNCSYTRRLGGYPNGYIIKEIKKGIEIIQKIKIFLGRNIHISNAFYTEADSKLILEKNPKWRTDPHQDFFVPNLVMFEDFYLDKRGMRKFLKKYSVFEHKNFEVQLNRFIIGLERPGKDKINSMLDFLILLESILVDANSEISYQFSLFGSLFFAKKPSERKELSEFFKLLYKLRSEIVHGKDNSEIEKAIKKLREKDIRWLERLSRYCHQILLFIVNENIRNKKDFINRLKKKIHL